MANKKVVKLSKQRNKKTVKKLLKLAVIPVVILVVLSALFLSARLMGNVAVSNITDAVREVKTVFTKGEGYPHALDALTFRKATAIGSKPLVIYDDSSVVLSSSASKIFSNQLTSGDSKVFSKNGRALIYSNTSNKVILQSRSEILGTLEEEGSIVTVDLSKNGCVATSYTTSEKQSVLKVYDRYFKNQFQWECSQEYISSIALSKNGKNVVIAEIGTENAEIFTNIILFNTKSEKPVAELHYGGTLFLEVIYTDSNKIIAVGDNKTVVLDKNGKVIEELDYSEDSIISVDADDSGNTVVCYKEFGGSKTAVVRYSKSGKMTFSIVTDGVPDCVAAYGSKTALVSGNEIFIYSSKGEESEKIETEHPVTEVFWCSGTLYTVENGHIYRY